MNTPLNVQLAMKLEEMAELLQQQDANRFRIAAYRRAATSLTQMKDDIGEIFEQQGAEGLTALPGIGRGIATALAELLTTGHWSQLERLRGGLDPVRLLQTVPGIGPEMAKRIHDGLHIDSLEALETAAHDGRLQTVKGMGSRRLSALRASLAAMLGRTRSDRGRLLAEPPTIERLLGVDHDYRTQARADKLPRIAPRRFNPKGDAWLPVLHTDADGWHFTAMYSNTARAHELGQTRDWVVIYCYDHEHQEGQFTVVTETHGPLIGKRVVRGRERECREFYLGSIHDAEQAS